MVPYAAQGCFSDDQLNIVVQPDQRFFLEDCHVMESVRDPGASSSSAGPEQAKPPPGDVRAFGDDPIEDILMRPHRPGKAGLAETAGDEFSLPTPELLDLLRLRKQAASWKEHREGGQGEFIWWCHNSGQYRVDCAGNLALHCSESDLATIKNHNGKEWRNGGFSAGDVGVMFTSRWARMFMDALAAP